MVAQLFITIGAVALAFLMRSALSVAVIVQPEGNHQLLIMAKGELAAPAVGSPAKSVPYDGSINQGLCRDRPAGYPASLTELATLYHH